MKTRKKGHDFFEGVIDGLQPSKGSITPIEKMDFKLKATFSDYSCGKPIFLLTSKPTFGIDEKMKLLGTKTDSLRSELDRISWKKSIAQAEYKIVEKQLFDNISTTRGSGNLVNPYGAKKQEIIPLQMQELKHKQIMATLFKAHQYDAIKRVVASDDAKNKSYFFEKMQIGLSSSHSEKSNLTSVTSQNGSSSILDHVESAIEKHGIKNLIQKVDNVLPGVAETVKVVNRASFFEKLIEADTCKRVGILTTTANMVVGNVALNRLPIAAIPLRTLSFLTSVSATSVVSYGSVKLGEFAEAKCREFQELDLNRPMKK